MPDLHIHIGLAKTASSTLQSRLMSGRPGYLGKNKVDFPPAFGYHDLVDELQVLASQCHYLGIKQVESRIEDWVRAVVSWAADRDYEGPICISDENIAHWPVNRRNQHNRHPLRHTPARWRSAPRRTRPIPVARLVKEHLVKAWSPHGQVKLCLVLRNQADWLGSLYAQRSNCIVFPSTGHFETQVSRMLEMDEPYLDWYSLVMELRDAVGEDALTILFFEEAGTEIFWSRLGGFFGVTDADWKAFALGAHRVNERRKGDEGWRIRPLFLLLLIYQTYTQHWSAVRRQLFYRTTHHFFRSVVAPTLELFRKKSFVLTDECRSRIKMHCHESNAKLAQIVSRDLGTMGY